MTGVDGTPGNLADKMSEHVMTPHGKQIAYNSNRRSQSELQIAGLNSENDGAVNLHKLNPLALDLVQVIGKDRSAYGNLDKNGKKIRMSQRSSYSQKKGSARQSSHQLRQSQRQSQHHGMLTNKEREGTTDDNKTDLRTEIKASELQDADLKDLR